MQGSDAVPGSAPPDSNAITRRTLIATSGLWASLVALATTSDAALASHQATPADPARVQDLLALSQHLCGGGRFDPDRAAMLLDFLSHDPVLANGLDDLLANPPVEGTPLDDSEAGTTAQAILVFWYAGIMQGEPAPNRGSAYYGLTAWQAMYTPSWAVCKVFGGWADPPQPGPLVPAND